MADPIVPSTTTSAPYYDDYNEDKEFYRILFRPGYAVQARELTQLQTILQKQVQRLGDYVFKNGSMVTGGKITYQGVDEKIAYINLQSNFGGTAITANNFVGKVIKSANTIVGNTTAYVLAAEELNSTEPATLVVKFTNGIALQPGDTISTVEATPVYANVATSAATGNASVISIAEGVYYYNGFFTKVIPQTLILDKYDNTPTYRVGLQYSESIVDSDGDTSLLDPAQEASNYQAPGATRFKIDPVLAKRTLTSTDDTQFVNLFVVENGTITQVVQYPELSGLGDTFARRTFDESGNYTVKAFAGELQNHVPQKITGNISASAGGTTITGNGTLFKLEVSANSTLTVNGQAIIVSSVTSNTSLVSANTLTYNTPAGFVSYVTNPDKFSFKLSPGKAYIKGYEFETIAPVTLGLKRARTSSAVVNNYDLYSPLGAYVFVTNANGIPKISTTQQFDLHNKNSGSIDVTSANAYNTSKIGTARVRAFEYSSATNTANSRSYIYKAYLTDVNIANASFGFTSVRAIANLVTAGANAYNPILDIDASSTSNNNVNGNTLLKESNFSTLIYPYPQQFITAGSITDVDYRYRKFATGTTFSGNSASLTLVAPEVFVGSGALAQSDILSNWIVVVKDKATSVHYSNGSIVPAANLTVTISGAGATATITAANVRDAVTDIIYSVDLTGTAPGPRTKTKITANTTVIPTVANSYISDTTSSVFTANGVVVVNYSNNVIKTTGTAQPLYISDVIKLSKVLDFGANTGNGSVTTTNLAFATDITSRYVLDNGQRDGFYDHASISLRPGYPAPTNAIAIFVDFYTHAGTSGYLTVDSYPNATTSDGYAAISTYTSPTTGQLYYLRDCVDWRPKRLNGTTNFTLVDSDTGTDAYLLQPGQDFTSDFTYYLSRIDKIVLTKDAGFKVIEGVPDLYPVTPVEGPDDMLLYTLKVPAYTAAANSVDVRFTENKRYTMRDIGRLEKRIENLEYYTSLNLLEKTAEALTVVDSNGLTRFKNGIIVDSFSGHKIGDVSSPDYICSMDFEKGELWPAFISKNSQFYHSANTSATNHGGIITLNYTTANYITQNVATRTVSVNEFNYATFIGPLQLFPDNDTFYDQNIRPLVLVNVEGENDAYEAMGAEAGDTRSPGFGTRYNEWQSAWAGLPRSTVQNGVDQLFPGYELIQQGVSRSTDSITTKQARGLIGPVISPENIKQTFGAVSLDTSVIPYTRTKDVIVRSSGLMPSSVFFPRFDNTDMLAYWINPTAIQVTTTSGNFFANSYEKITSTSGGTARVVLVPGKTSIVANITSNIVSVVLQTGFINVGDTITGTNSGATAVVTKVSRFSDNVSGENANTYKINLATTAANTSNIAFGNSIVSIVKGTGAGQVRVIAGYDNVQRVITTTVPWTTTPDTTSVYNIFPPISTRFGSIAGVLSIPANTFVTGEKSVVLSTNPGPLTDAASSYGKGTYYALGYALGYVSSTNSDKTTSVRPPVQVVDVPGSDNTTSIQNDGLGLDAGRGGIGSQSGNSGPGPEPEAVAASVAASAYNVDNPEAAALGNGGGGGGGGGGKIICTAMNEAYGFGSFRQSIWLEQSASLSKKHEIGYHAMCLPIVNYVYKTEKNNVIKTVLRNVMEHVVRHRTADIWKQKKGKRDALGMIYRSFFEPLVYVIGYVKTIKKGDK